MVTSKKVFEAKAYLLIYEKSTKLKRDLSSYDVPVSKVFKPEPIEEPIEESINHDHLENDEAMSTQDTLSDDDEVTTRKVFKYFPDVHQELTSAFKKHHRRFPSVSDILSHFYANVYGHVNNSFDRQRGTAIHEYIKQYLTNDCQIEVVDKYVKFYKPIVKAMQKITDVYCVEGSLFSEVDEYQGHCDCLAMLNNKLTMIEFKTTKSKILYNTNSQTAVVGALMQAAAYAKAFNDLELDDFADIEQVCVMVGAEDCFAPIIYTGKVQKYYNLFLKQLHLYNNR